MLKDSFDSADNSCRVPTSTNLTGRFQQEESLAHYLDVVEVELLNQILNRSPQVGFLNYRNVFLF